MSSLKTYTPEQLKEILEQHRLFLETQYSGDQKGARAYLRSANLRSANLRSANLSGADLSGAYLSGANLRSANLSGADLRSANLSGADLSGAYLSGADLSGANLSGAYLSGANLRSADLSGADLSGADLSGAYLSGANLRSANLSGANLRSANLSGADLRSANLSGADLRSANLSETKTDKDTTWPTFAIVPEEGAFIAFKKVRGAVLKLEIPADAQRTSSMIGRKCRASKAKVLEAFPTVVSGCSCDLCKETIARQKQERAVQTRFASLHAGSAFMWTVGEMHEEPGFNGDPRIECASGLHFFMTRAEAEAYDS